MWKKTQTNGFLIFQSSLILLFIHIFWYFRCSKIASLLSCWLQIKFSMLLFFYWFTFASFATNLWHQKFVTADVTAVFVNNQRGIQRRGQDFHKKFVVEGVYTAERFTKECPEKSCTKHGAGKLLRKLRDTGTVDRRPGNGRPRSEKEIVMPSYA